MRIVRGTRGVVGLLACTALLTVAGATYFQPRLSMPTVETEGMTKSQVLSLSEPLLQALLVGATKVETVASPIVTFNPSGQTIHSWNIDCTDLRSGDTAHLLLNGDTGELMRASHYRKNERYARFNPDSPQKTAIGLAWDWSHALKIVGATEGWRVIGTHKKAYGQWDVCLRAGDHYAILTVKTDTGQLIQTMCGHLPSATMAWAPFRTDMAS